MTTFEPGTFTPAPGVGRIGPMLATHVRTEALLVLRHGEQLLLTLIIPLALLIAGSELKIVPLPEPRVDHVIPAVLALAVMSTAFTGQAISLGFDRRYGVIKRLAATALPHWLLVVGRVLATFVVVAVQLIVLCGTAFALGWRPPLAGLGWMLLLIVLGTLAFGALGVLIGGSLRADVVLALANTLWLVLLVGGGIALPTSRQPAGMAGFVELLPSAALTNGLRDALVDGTGPGIAVVLVLLAWIGGAGWLASRTMKLS
ncbi:multidrug ABC transporter permease [Pseudonocardiaceae bacterium YIM PH 21723]|nr:multidrug ABC transporter permease [Pseudonocardiaceae bacterium YIM PH 21723]